MYIVTADRIRSRRDPGDAVPLALSALSEVTGLMAERTVGDEVQAVTDSPLPCVAAVTALTTLDGWRIGIGLGPVDSLDPASPRSSHGPAFVAAREAIAQARTAPQQLAVRAPRDPQPESAGHAAAALWLLAAALRRRSPEGAEASALEAQGVSRREIATRLRISEQAVQQRLARALHREVAAGVDLCAWALGLAHDDAT
ncbi:MAG: sigma-70 region 4 domain-containing protein [Micrococcales bacterium]|nr:sigma-70 region 4 domain-containing protein [Micrococcales bacterium]